MDDETAAMMFDLETWWQGFRLLLILGVANSTPILATRLLGQRWSAPLDGGYEFFDGRPLLGPSKTWRGVLAALVCTPVAAAALGIAPFTGAVIGAVAMLGDAMSSFVKRRIRIASSDRATGIDQIPEALLPLLAVYTSLELTPIQVVSITMAFFLLEMPAAWLSFRMGLRNRPY